MGEALYSAAAPAVQSLGAHVIALFLFLAALLLLTGATIAGVVHALRTGLVGTGRVLRDSGRRKKKGTATDSSRG